MLTNFRSRLALTAALTLASSVVLAAAQPISVYNPTNGLTGIYSGSFAGPLAPCSGGSPSYCSFFGGLPSAGQLAAVNISPNASGVVNALPGGIGPTGIPVAPVPASGSYLDLTLSGGNTALTLSGGTITFGGATLTIVPAATTAVTSGAGMVFDAAPQVTSVNGLGQAEFLVNLAPGLAVDFSRFSQVTTSCVGGVCGLIVGDVLNLDMVRYRLFVQYNPSFTDFDATFIGQTGNNSMVFANMSTVPVPAAVWLMGSGLGLLSFLRRKVSA